MFLFNKDLFTILTFISFFASSGILSAMQPFVAEAEEVLYKKGVTYRDESKFENAIDCFRPLAEKKYVKCQHNLAFCLYNLGEEKEAYHWYSCAASQGFQPSKNNLKKMNLLYLLLPNELLVHLTSFLNLKELNNFQILSQSASRVFISAITKPNLLTSKIPYAQDLYSKFAKVNFDPIPKAIRLSRFAKSKNGSIKVYFFNEKHLREIVAETPSIDVCGENKIYFVRDQHKQMNTELEATDGDLQTGYFFHVIADTPLKVSGETKLPCELFLPNKSDYKELDFKGKGIQTGQVEAYKEAHDLASLLKNFNEELYKIRTKDAYELLEDAAQSRLRLPDLYPDLEDCPDFYIGGEAEIKQKDYICSKKPFVYIAKSVAELDELQEKLPEFGDSICFVDPECTQAGVYSLGPLSFLKGFEISAPGDLVISGEISLDDHNLKIVTHGSFWSIGSSILVKGSLRVYSHRCLYSLLRYGDLKKNIKPKNMTQKMWENLCRFWIENDLVVQ